MGVIGTNDLITESAGLPLDIGILAGGYFETVLPAEIETVPAGSDFINHIVDIAPVIDIFLSGKQTAALVRLLPKSMLLNNLEFTSG